MSDDRHSPGPWRWQDDSERVLLDADGVMVLTQGDLTQADDADAHLIAAAPEMLALLRLSLGTTDSVEEGEDRPLVMRGSHWHRRVLALLARIDKR